MYHPSRVSLPVVAGALLFAQLAWAHDDALFAGAEVLDPDVLVQSTLQRNISVGAAEAAFEAAAAVPGMAGALPDPMLSLEAAPFSAFSADAPFGASVRVSQRVPFPGKRGLAREAAEAEASAAKSELAALRLKLREAALAAFANWYEADRALAINSTHQVLLKDFKRAAEVQYGAGVAPQQDVLQAELMLAELEMERVELQSRRRRVAAQINALLHRPPTAHIPPAPRTLDAKLTVPPEDVVQKEALADRPMLDAMGARVAAAHKRVELANKAWLPDFEVMGGYSSMWMDPAHRVMVGIGVELPLQQQMRHSQVAEAKAMAKRMENDLEHARYEASAEAEQMRQMLDEAVQMLAVQRDRVLPAARAQLEAARAGYISGRSEFMGLIEAERALRTAELRLHVAHAEVVRRRAALEQMIGEVP